MARICAGARGRKILTHHRGNDRHKRLYLMRAASRDASTEQLKRWSSPVMDAVAFFGLLLSIAVVLGVLFQPLGAKRTGSAAHNEHAAFTSRTQGHRGCANDTSPAVLGDRSRTTYDECKGTVDRHWAQPVVHSSSGEPLRGQ